METQPITKESFTKMLEEYQQSPNILQIAKKYNVSYSALYGRIKILNRHREVDVDAMKVDFARGMDIDAIAQAYHLTGRQVRKLLNIKKPETARHNELMSARLQEAVTQYRSGNQQDVTILMTTYRVPRRKLEMALVPYGYVMTQRVNTTKEKVQAMFQAGHSRYEIRDALKVAYSTVFNYTKGLSNEKSGRWH